MIRCVFRQRNSEISRVLLRHLLSKHVGITDTLLWLLRLPKHREINLSRSEHKPPFCMDPTPSELVMDPTGTQFGHILIERDVASFTWREW